MNETTELTWIEVPDVEGLWEGDLLDVEVSGEEVLIVHHLDGQMRAFQGMCPHQEILLGDGEWDADRGTLTCNGHNWVFDMRTGDGINPAGCRLFEYPIRTGDGQVHVGIPQDNQRHYYRAAGE